MQTNLETIFSSHPGVKAMCFMPLVTTSQQNAFVQKANAFLNDAMKMEPVSRLSVEALSASHKDVLHSVALPKFLALKGRCSSVVVDNQTADYAERLFFQLRYPDADALSQPNLLADVKANYLNEVWSNVLHPEEVFPSKYKFYLQFDSQTFESSIDKMVSLLFVHAELNDTICDELLEQFFIAISDMGLNQSYQAIYLLVRELCKKDRELHLRAGGGNLFECTRQILEAACHHKACTQLFKLMFYLSPWEVPGLQGEELNIRLKEMDAFRCNASQEDACSDSSLREVFDEKEMVIDRDVSPEDRMRMVASVANSFSPREVVVYFHKIPWENKGFLPYYAVIIKAVECEDGVPGYLVGCGLSKISCGYSEIGVPFDLVYEAKPYELGKIGKCLIPDPFA